MDMSESHDLSVEELESFAGHVREASSVGSVVPLDGEEIVHLARSSGFDDLTTIREGGQVYAYSELHMTHRYAESAARARSDDLLQAVSETVRSDSATYPRPTPVTIFGERPFVFSTEQMDAALEKFATDPNYGDIRMICASDGSRFLFSARHLDEAQAASLAEWVAVGRSSNP
jgi:hypothetical protein